jgi:hypothetical protein
MWAGLSGWRDPGLEPAATTSAGWHNSHRHGPQPAKTLKTYKPATSPNGQI